MPTPRPTQRAPTQPRATKAPRQDATLLGLLARAFYQLPTRYPYLRVDGAKIGCGLPAEPLPPDVARDAVLRKTTSYADKDTAWRYLVTQARTEGPDWQLVAVGFALPGLHRRIRMKGIHRDNDVDAEIVTNFLERLQRVDIGPRNIAGRLINSSVQAYLRGPLRTGWPVHLTGEPDHLVGRKVGPATGHPVQVLRDLAVDGHISVDDARLIAVTRFGPLSLRRAAAELGITEQAATMRRLRAEEKIKKELLRHRRIADRPRPESVPAAAVPAEQQ